MSVSRILLSKWSTNHARIQGSRFVFDIICRQSLQLIIPRVPIQLQSCKNTGPVLSRHFHQHSRQIKCADLRAHRSRQVCWCLCRPLTRWLSLRRTSQATTRTAEWYLRPASRILAIAFLLPVQCSTSAARLGNSLNRKSWRSPIKVVMLSAHTPIPIESTGTTLQTKSWSSPFSSSGRGHRCTRQQQRRVARTSRHNLYGLLQLHR